MTALTGATRQSYVFRDHKANTARLTLYISSNYATELLQQAHALVLSQDLYALQTGDTQFLADGSTPVVRSIGPYITLAQPWSGTFNSSGAYHNVEDKARFVFMDAVGGRHQYEVPCPLTTIFLADQETIDNSQSIVKQFVADMLAATYSGTAPNAAATKAVVNASNQGLTSFVGGFRIRRRMRRKLNIFTRNPAETGPGE